jgi:hypothetical protein
LVVAFHFWNMFLWIGKVHIDVESVEHGIREWSKLVVASDYHDMECGFVVDLKNLFD